MPQLAPQTNHARHRLADAIIARSVAVTWDDARLEWDLSSVFFADKDYPGTCLCGHQPIIEHCVLANRENGNEAVVGNVCVQKFIGLPTEALFRGLRRIMADRAAALSLEVIHYAIEKGWVNDWERRFYLNTRGRQHLSERQRAKREEINARILYHVHRPQEDPPLRPRTCRQPSPAERNAEDQVNR
jgi:hypothetical protein